MVAGVDDDGIVIEALGLEVVEEALEVIVHTLHAAEIFAEVGLIGEVGGFAFREFEHIVVGGKFLGETLLEVDGVGSARVAFADGGADVRH